MNKKPLAVGWVGFGAMGAPMVRRVAEAGHAVHAVPRSAAQRCLLNEIGAHLHSDMLSLGAASDIVCSIVPGSTEVREVWNVTDGLLAGLRSGAIGVEMSTVGTDVVTEVAARAVRCGVAFADAPVSGGVNGAAAGKLAIFVGAEKATLAALDPVMTLLGTLHHTGGVGSGQVMKLVNQALVGANTFGLCLGWALASRNGLDPEATFTALTGGAADGRLLRLEWPMLMAGDMTSGFAASYMSKDLGLLRAFCSDSNIPTTVVDALWEAFDYLARHTPPLTATQALGESLAGRFFEATAHLAAERIDR